MTVEGRLEGIRHYTIHGGPYAYLYFSHLDDPDTVVQAQLPVEAFDADLAVGDRIVITYLLKTVMEIRRAPGTS
jgi:hypothetical protein